MAWHPVAWAADAALYCAACAEALYGPDGPDRRDREGNPVTPVFRDESFDAPQACDRCGAELAVLLTPEAWARRHPGND